MPRSIIGTTSAPPSTTPVNGVLDNFNRADSTTTLGANWTLLYNGFGSLANQGISSNQLYNPVGSFSNYVGMYWNPTIFGANQEVYMSIPTLNSNDANDNMVIYARVTNPGASFNGYGMTYYDSNGGVYLTKITNGTSVQIGTTGAHAMGSGYKLRLEVIGSTINGYIYNGTAWSLIISTTDTTYSAGGRIGFYIPGNTQDGRFDDFGGGTLADTVIPSRLAAGTRTIAGARTIIT